MIIGLVVAVVLVAGLMVPVISSLSTDNGNSNGNSEYLANNLSEIYASAGISIPEKYNSYQIYVSDTVGNALSSDSILDLDDLRDIYGSTYDVPYEAGGIILTEISWPDLGPQTLTGFRITYFFNSGITVDLFGSSGIFPLWEDLSKWTAFEMDFKNGHIHIENVVDDQTYTIDTPIDWGYMMSEEDDGCIWWQSIIEPEFYSEITSQVYNAKYYEISIFGESTPYSEPYIYITNSQINEYTENYLKINNCPLVDDYNSIDFTADITIPLEDGKMTHTTQATVSNVTSPDGYVLDSVMCYLEIVSTMAISEEGSGGSGSGISDTLMSLISVIPLITVVGIVLGAITIFRRG